MTAVAWTAVVSEAALYGRYCSSETHVKDTERQV